MDGFVLTQIRLYEMTSTSMEPTIIGQGNPPTHHGDYVIISKAVHHPLSRGDLVLVSLRGIRGPLVTTIRRVAGAPGDLVPDLKETNSTVAVTLGYYYLLADATNALDSRQLGLFSHTQIDGKVLFVIH